MGGVPRGVCAVAALLSLAATSASWSCSATSVRVAVPVAAYVPAGCGDAGGARVTYTGLGDFPQSSPASEVSRLGSTGELLAQLPPATREIVVTPESDAAPWAAAALVPDAGPVNLLTLPEDRACPLSKPVGLGGDPGTTVGSVDATHVLFLGEVAPFLVDLSVGSVTELGGSPALGTRDYASITPFAGGALVAGGEDPGNNQEAYPDAVVFTVATGSFGASILLPSRQREKHGSAALADGRVVLVGGETDTGETVSGIDVFSPEDPTAPTSPATLTEPRISPTVLALPDGELFVGGGVDKSGEPVASVEWFGPNFQPHTVQPLCGASATAGFASTEGGAVLAVMGMAASPGCSNVQLLRASGAEQAPPLVPPPRLVRLFTGAEASPVLLTDTAASRWNPWTSLFSPLGAAAAGLNSPTNAVVAATTGLALWLADDDSVWLLRFDTHGAYATDVAHGPYLLTDDEFTAPGQLAAPDAAVYFEPSRGATLSEGATVWLTDATFASLTASITLPVGGAATLLLRDPAGNLVRCSAEGVPPRGTLNLARTGSSVSMSVGDGGSSSCAGELDGGARVAVGVQGPDAGIATVRALTVTR